MYIFSWSLIMNFLSKLLLRSFMLSLYSISLLSMNTENKKELSLGQQATIGAGMGIMDAVVSTPLTSIKNTRQADLPLSRNPRDYFKGFLTFAGTLTPIAQAQNVSYETLKADYGVPSWLAAPAAGATAAIIVNPIDLIVRHVQTDQDQAETTKNAHGETTKKASTFNTTRQLYKQHGLRCFGRGLEVTMGRDSFYAAAYLEGMNRARKAIAKKTDNKAMIHFGTLASGFGIGIVATLATQPLDTIQGKMHKGKGFGTLGYKSTLLAIKMIPKEIDEKTGKKAGWKAYYKGTLGRSLLVSASILVLDGAKETFSTSVTNC